MKQKEIEEKFIRFVLSKMDEYASKNVPEGDHLDEDALRDFVLNMQDLKSESRSKELKHIASCPKCRERTVVLIKKYWFYYRAKQILAVAATVLIIIGTYFILNITNNLPWQHVRYAVIITEEESSLPRIMDIGEEVSDGPEIVMISPKEEVLLDVPVKIHIAFKKGPYNFPPDMNTLKIIYLRLSEPNITDRFKNYIKGNEILIDNAMFPPGEHILHFTIEDKGGFKTSKNIVFNIK